MENFFGNTISKWYKNNRRNLPWRNTTDPYKIWLSEIILQQTQVAQGLNYYLKFVENFPSVRELAEASEMEVLKLWQGLGYYSRARNLHFTARYIAEELDCIFPNTYKEIIKLKGVGPYTASAISSFAFDDKKAVLDGNVYRVLSRFFGVRTPINTTEGNKEFSELSERVLPLNTTQDYNQGIMDFGALQCTPKNPKCESCPLNAHCYAYLNKETLNLPKKLKKVKVKELYIYFFFSNKEGRLPLVQREGSGIWQNLWEFPNISSNIELEVTEAVVKFSGLFQTGNLKVKYVSNGIKHLLTHRRIYAHFIEIDDFSPNHNFKGQFLTISDLEDFPVHRLMDKFLSEYLESN